MNFNMTSAITFVTHKCSAEDCWNFFLEHDRNFLVSHFIIFLRIIQIIQIKIKNYIRCQMLKSLTCSMLYIILFFLLIIMIDIYITRTVLHLFCEKLCDLIERTQAWTSVFSATYWKKFCLSLMKKVQEDFFPE